LELVGRGAVHVAVHTNVHVPLSANGMARPVHRVIPPCECEFPKRHERVALPPIDAAAGSTLTVGLSPSVLHKNAALAASGTDPVAAMVGHQYMMEAKRAARRAAAPQSSQTAANSSDCTTTSVQFLKTFCRESLAAAPETDPDETFASVLAGMIWGADLSTQVSKDIETLGWKTWIAFAKVDILTVARWGSDETDEIRKAKARQVSEDLEKKGAVLTLAAYRTEADAAVRAFSARRQEQLGLRDE
jgi:hypothetical protein